MVLYSANMAIKVIQAATIKFLIQKEYLLLHQLVH